MRFDSRAVLIRLTAAAESRRQLVVVISRWSRRKRVTTAAAHEIWIQTHYPRSANVISFSWGTDTGRPSRRRLRFGKEPASVSSSHVGPVAMSLLFCSICTPDNGKIGCWLSLYRRDSDFDGRRSVRTRSRVNLSRTRFMGARQWQNFVRNISRFQPPVQTDVASNRSAGRSSRSRFWYAHRARVSHRLCTARRLSPKSFAQAPIRPSQTIRESQPGR